MKCAPAPRRAVLLGYDGAVSQKVASLLAALRKLAARPTDHGAWLAVAGQLVALGHAELAERALWIVGESGVRGGQVALAVACGRLLAQRGNVRGPELLEEVAVTYCRGSDRIADDGLPAPHGEAVALTLPEDSESLAGDALAAAVAAAFDALEPAATKPAPGKLPPAPLVSALPVGGARALIGVTSARSVRAGEAIVAVGQPATSLYWLAYGTVTVSRGGVRLGELHGGAFFGEIALVGGTTRTAQVAARTDVWLLEIPARAVEAAAQRHPQLAEVLAAHAKARLLANLRTSELFCSLAPADRAAVLERFQTQIVEAGEQLIREGEGGAHLWVVVTGGLEVTSAGAEVARLGAGAVVGEISLVSGKPAVADVHATERSVLLRLSREDFQAVAAEHPAVLEGTLGLVTAREEQNRALFQDASDLLV